MTKNGLELTGPFSSHNACDKCAESGSHIVYVKSDFSGTVGRGRRTLGDVLSFMSDRNQNSKLSANNDFDNQGSYTIPSKMNSLEKDNLSFDPNEDPPF